MLIRSQDKRQLITMEIGYVSLDYRDLRKILFSTDTTDADSWISLGEYSTEDKAIKVLDMIQENYMNLDSVRMGYPTSKGCSSVFQMPSDEEVEG